MGDTPNYHVNKKKNKIEALKCDGKFTESWCEAAAQSSQLGCTENTPIKIRQQASKESEDINGANLLGFILVVWITVSPMTLPSYSGANNTR